MPIYTKNGDQGNTTLLSGKKLPKNDLLLSVVGNFDELNSCMGMIRSFLSDNPKTKHLDPILSAIQKVIFSIGSELSGSKFSLGEKFTHSLEEMIDYYDKQLPSLTSFILPSGSKAASSSHLARTVCRRSERLLVALNQKTKINPNILNFTNRLSDFLFVLARYLNFVEGVKEEQWKI